MAGNFTGPEGDLETPFNNFSSYFIDEYSFIDQYNPGSLWTWGYNAYGQLGDNTVSTRQSPIQTIANTTNWIQVSAGIYHVSGIKSDGTLWIWGYNNNGELGDNTVVRKSSPVQTVAGANNWIQVSCGEAATGAIKSDGTLWMWGSNGSGQLGDNTITKKSSPVQTVAGGNNWKQVSVGTSAISTVSAAINISGQLFLWGYNGYGALGDNTRTNKSSPVQTVSGGTNWKQVSCGDSHVGAIKTDGTLWMWGNNGSGQLGDNTTNSSSSPVQTVSGGTNWKQVSCGWAITGAIKTDGTLWLWGEGPGGQLGDNTITKKSSPIQTVAGGTNWKQVSISAFHSTGLKTDGTLWTWGYNTYGELGDNTTTKKSSPIQTVSGGTNWKQVSAGNEITIGIYFYDYNNQYPNK